MGPLWLGLEFSRFRVRSQKLVYVHTLPLVSVPLCLCVPGPLALSELLFLTNPGLQHWKATRALSTINSLILPLPLPPLSSSTPIPTLIMQGIWILGVRPLDISSRWGTGAISCWRYFRAISPSIHCRPLHHRSQIRCCYQCWPRDPLPSQLALFLWLFSRLSFYALHPQSVCASSGEESGAPWVYEASGLAVLLVER